MGLEIRPRRRFELCLPLRQRGSLARSVPPDPAQLSGNFRLVNEPGPICGSAARGRLDRSPAPADGSCSPFCCRSSLATSADTICRRCHHAISSPSRPALHSLPRRCHHSISSPSRPALSALPPAARSVFAQRSPVTAGRQFGDR